MSWSILPAFHSSQFISAQNLWREAVFLTMRPESLRLVISSSLHNTVPNWCQRFDLQSRGSTFKTLYFILISYLKRHLCATVSERLPHVNGHMSQLFNDYATMVVYLDQGFEKAAIVQGRHASAVMNACARGGDASVAVCVYAPDFRSSSITRITLYVLSVPLQFSYL